jgi:hypothetical protein
VGALYARASGATDFPFDPPQYRYALDEVPNEKPSFPSVKSPPEIRVALLGRDGAEIDGTNEMQARAYRSELDRVASLSSYARQLRTTFEDKHAAALEAADMMDIYLGELTLKWKEAEFALRREFENVKRAYEDDARKTTQWIRAVNQRYAQRTEKAQERTSNWRYVVFSFLCPMIIHGASYTISGSGYSKSISAYHHFQM